MRIWCYETMEKSVDGSLSLMFKCSWEMLFFKSKDTEVFRGSLVDYHFLYSHDPNAWFRDDIEKRN